MSDTLWTDPRPRRYAIAASHDRAGDVEGAAREYRRLSAVWPSYRAVIRYNLASVLARQGHERRATVLFRGIADDLDAGSSVRAGAHFHLGRLADASGRSTAARDHYRSALVLAPDHAGARDRLSPVAESRPGDAPAPLPRPRRGRRPRGGAGDGPVLVYQMGKVGSTSLHAGLKACLPDTPIHHSHLLDPRSFARYERWFAHDPALPAALVASTRGQIAAAHGYRHDLLSDGPRWRVITLTREPMAHLVSVLFHHLAIYRRLSDANAPGAPVLDRLHAFAIDSLRRWVDAAGQPDVDPARAALTLASRWFDEELGPVLSVDVYARPFATDRGAVRWRTPRADVVLVRFEDLPWAAPDAVRALVGRDDFLLPAENRAQDRPSGASYLEYLRRCRFPADLVAAVYATRYATHFYSESERAELARRWSDS
jgi:hypothetical protein